VDSFAAAHQVFTSGTKNPIDGGAIGFVRMMIDITYRPIMTDRTPQQVDMTLDRVEQISAQNTVNIAEMQTYISQFVRVVEQQIVVQNERLDRQDTLIQLLSTYITGTPPQA
jgi:hypothetical protein